MDYKATTTRSIEFSAAHMTANADPAEPESQLHGHRYRLTVTSTDLETTWVGVEDWVRRYLHMRDLGTTLNFPTTPARIAAYVATVFQQLDPRIDRVELQVDGRDTVAVQVDDAGDIAARVYELNELRSRLH